MFCVTDIIYFVNDSEYETKLNAEVHIDELVAISTRGTKIEPDEWDCTVKWQRMDGVTEKRTLWILMVNTIDLHYLWQWVEMEMLCIMFPT